MAEDLQNVIKKVQGLLALTKNNTSEHEVKAAAAAADKIMQAYRLTQAQVEAQDSSQAEPFVRKVVSKGGRRTNWRETLLWSLTVHYGCCFYLSSKRVGGEYGKGAPGSKGIQSYTVVGRKSDTDIVEYMFLHLEGEVERLSRTLNRGKGVKYGISWMNGCASGIAKQFSDMREAARTQAQAEENTCAALVILDKRQDESKVHMDELLGKGAKKAAGITGGRDYGARVEGFGVGKSLHINTEVPGATIGALKGPKTASVDPM